MRRFSNNGRSEIRLISSDKGVLDERESNQTDETIHPRDIPV